MAARQLWTNYEHEFCSSPFRGEGVLHVDNYVVWRKVESCPVAKNLKPEGLSYRDEICSNRLCVRTVEIVGVPTLLCSNTHNYQEIFIAYMLLRFVREFHFGNFFLRGSVQLFADDVGRESGAQQRTVQRRKFLLVNFAAGQA